MSPNSSQALTRMTVRAHWKKRSALGAVKEKPASACLFSRVRQPEDAA